MIQSDSAPDADRSFLKSLGWASPRFIDATLAASSPNSLPTDPTQRKRWLLYTLLQQTADSRNLDALAWANDERAEDYLDAIAAGILPPEFNDLCKWLKYLPGNRAQKHVHRARLLKRRCHDICRPDPPSPEAAAEHADDLARVRHLATDREWALLNRVACYGLAAVADAERMPVGTLKAQLSRCRCRLRQAS
jgi:hypothetical protein